MRQRNNLTGHVFGRLTVLSFDGHRTSNTGVSQCMWLCQCECGNTKSIHSLALKSKVRSCGCLASEVLLTRSVTHGYTRNRTVTTEYRSYASAKNRCRNPRNDRYASYGGRGIEFRFESFEQFLSVLGIKPTPQHSLDRFPDKNGHYEPGNVRWATSKEQAANRRSHGKKWLDGEPHNEAIIDAAAKQFNPAPSPATTPQKAVSRLSFAASQFIGDVRAMVNGVVANDTETLLVFVSMVILGFCGIVVLGGLR